MFNWRNLFGGQQQGLLAPQGLPYQDVQPQQPMSLLGVHGPNGVVQNPPQAPQSKGNWADNLFGGGLLGQDVGLSPEAQKGARNQALLMAGLSMMANSAKRPGPPTGLGEILLGGLQAGQQGYGQSLRSGLAGQQYKIQKAAQAASSQAGQGLDWTKPESWAEYASRLDSIPGREGDAQAARKYYAELSKPKDSPADVQAYEYARQQDPNIGSYADWTLRKTKAGATNVNTNVSVSGEKKFAETLGTQVGEQVAATTQAARGAIGTINTVNRIREAMQGSPYMGPGAGVQQFLAQVGEKLGIAGKGTAERLANTRTTIQGLSQLNLDAAEQMRGQGQITEAERALLAKSVGGEFDKLTPGELSLLLDVNERIARFKLETNRKNVERLRGQPGAEGIADYFDVPAPAPYNPMPRQNAPASGGWSINPVP